MALDYLDFEYSEDEDGNGTWDAMASVPAPRWGALLDEVAAGKEVCVLRRGKEVARLVPPKGRRRRLPSLGAFRRSLLVRGDPLSATVVRLRADARY